jgi:hypothetical protein
MRTFDIIRLFIVSIIVFVFPFRSTTEVTKEACFYLNRIDLNLLTILLSDELILHAGGDI